MKSIYQQIGNYFDIDGNMVYNWQQSIEDPDYLEPDINEEDEYKEAYDERNYYDTAMNQQ